MRMNVGDRPSPITHSKNPQERAADYGQETPTWQNSENKMVWKYLSCQTKKRRTLVCVCGLNHMKSWSTPFGMEEFCFFVDTVVVSRVFLFGWTDAGLGLVVVIDLRSKARQCPSANSTFGTSNLANKNCDKVTLHPDLFTCSWSEGIYQMMHFLHLDCSRSFLGWCLLSNVTFRFNELAIKSVDAGSFGKWCPKNWWLLMMLLLVIEYHSVFCNSGHLCLILCICLECSRGRVETREELALSLSVY